MNEEEIFKKNFNDKYAKKLREKGLLKNANKTLIKLLQSLGMLNENVLEELEEGEAT